MGLGVTVAGQRVDGALVGVGAGVFALPDEVGATGIRPHQTIGAEGFERLDGLRPNRTAREANVAMAKEGRR